MAKLPLVAAFAGILVAASPTFAASSAAGPVDLSLQAASGLTTSPSTLHGDPGAQLISDKKSSKKKKKKQKGKDKKGKKSDDNKSSSSKSKSGSHDLNDDHGNHANDPSHT